MNNVDCYGDEENLIDCEFDEFHNCVHSEDASVSCSQPGYLKFVCRTPSSLL